MKKKLLTGLTGVAAATFTLMASSSINASISIPAPKAICTYQGTTVLLQEGGADVTCVLTVVAEVGCDGDHLHIVSAGASPGDFPGCTALSLGNLPWGGSLSAIMSSGGGSIDTGHTGLPIPWSVIDSSTFTPLAGGVLDGVKGSGSVAASCNSGSVNVPSSISINGNFSYLGASLVTPSGMNLVSCK